MSAFPFMHMPTFEWTSLGSFVASVVLLRALIQQYVPPELISALRRFVDRIVGSLRNSIIIEECNPYGSSEAYENALTYLSDKFSYSAQILLLSQSSDSKDCLFTVGANQTLHDHFHGVKVTWNLYTRETKRERGREEVRYLNLSFEPRFRQLVRDSYIPHVMEVARESKRKLRVRKIYTNQQSVWTGCLWTPVNFDHPATFETLAIDPKLKATVKNDLREFLKREKYCKRVGRAWKRGYLLYGPPGTGKTSLIAAIANYLEFDIYDLELTAVSSNLMLRRLLLGTRRKSVIVIEDIDCSLNFSDRNCNGKNGSKEGEEEEKKVTQLSLSGVLNFMDGLWSCCGEERLMVFTTNYKEKLDPALLRAGRMDLHIHLSYCGVPAFRQLVKNYLEVEEHFLMREIEELLGKVDVTPADITELLMGNEDPDLALGGVVSFLNERLIGKLEAESGYEKEVESVNME